MLHDQTLVYLTTFKPDMGEHDSDVFELMYVINNVVLLIYNNSPRYEGNNGSLVSTYVSCMSEI